MSTVPVHGHIAVGVDGSMASAAALRWAARTAQLHSRPLHVIATVDWPFPAVTYGVRSRTWTDGALATDCRSAVAVAVAIGQRLAPAVPVSGEVAAGSPAAVLASESARASMVVIGGRHPRLTEWLPGSLAPYLAARAECPIVTVPPRWDGGGLERGPVVVGVDGSELANLAAGFAFEEAARRGAPLIAVRVHPDRAGDVDSASAQRLRLSRSVRRWQPAYPDVDARKQIATGSPVDALLEASTGGQLLVVGSRGLGAVRGLLLGSVSLRLLHRAACPVAIVHPHHHDHGRRRHHRVAAIAAGG